MTSAAALTRPLRALIVEDSEFDAILMINALGYGGVAVDHVRVQTGAALEAALAGETWDVVLCDFSLPTLSGLEALVQVRAHDPDLPFILVSGTVSQHVVAEMLKKGANDCVMKNDMTLLAPAVRRALREADGQRARRQLEQALQRSEANFRDFVMHSADGFFLASRDGDLLMVNPRLCEITGYSEPELLRLRVEALLPMENPVVSNIFRARPHRAAAARIEHRLPRADGSPVPVEISLRLAHHGDVLAAVREISPPGP